MKKIYLNLINPTLVVSIALLATIFYGCEKEEKNNTENEEIYSNSYKRDVIYHRGHCYARTPFGEYEHIGYYMRTYKETGIMACFFGPDCYGRTGNCLPEIVVVGSIGNIDGEGITPNTIEYFDLSDTELANINLNYNQNLLSILDTDSKNQYNFFMNTISTHCSNIPQQLILDFAKEELIIKQFPEGIHIVNKDAGEYNDIPNYEW